MGGGPPGFTRDSTSLALLWYASQRGPDRVAYGAFTLCGPLSSRFRYDRFCNPSRRPQPRSEDRFGLCPLSLAATDGIDVSFFSCGYLDVSVPRVRFRRPMNSGADDRGSPGPVSRFGHPRINARLPASRGLSQATASFVASRCQDIHRTPLRA